MKIISLIFLCFLSGCSVFNATTVTVEKYQESCINDCKQKVRVSSLRQVDINTLYYSAIDKILEECKSGNFQFEAGEEEIVICAHCKKAVVEHSLSVRFKCY